MNGKLTKKSIKIVTATGMAIFSLTTVFTATYAWFAMNKTVVANGMAIKAKNENGRLNKVEIFELEEINFKNIDDVNYTNYSFNNVPSATYVYDWDNSSSSLIENSFPMGMYNPLDKEHPLLLLFTLGYEYNSTAIGDIYIKGNTEASGYLGETTNEGLPRYNLSNTQPTLYSGSKSIEIDGETINNIGCYPLSSVVDLTCTQYSEAQYTTLLDNSETGRIDILKDSLALNEQFVNFSSGSYVNFKNDPTIYQSPGNNTAIRYIAMVIDYNSDAITGIYSTYLGDPILEDDYEGALCFTCDWSLEVF